MLSRLGESVLGSILDDAGSWTDRGLLDYMASSAEVRSTQRVLRDHSLLLKLIEGTLVLQPFSFHGNDGYLPHLPACDCRRSYWPQF